MEYLLSRIEWSKAMIGFVSSFIGIAVIAMIAQFENIYLLIPSFGASAVLLFAAPQAPMANHKNVLFGHLISALVGVAAFQIFGISWFSCALAVSTSIGLMIITKTLHPPGGATALYALLTQQSWNFVLVPIGLGVLSLIVAAKMLNTLFGFLKQETRCSKAIN